MSKPDPNITANLLKSVLTKAEAHHEGDPKVTTKGAHAEVHADAKAASTKPKAAKHGAGPGRMRSCNRGK
jgi:hypothetical protein